MTQTKRPSQIIRPSYWVFLTRPDKESDYEVVLMSGGSQSKDQLTQMVLGSRLAPPEGYLYRVESRTWTEKHCGAAMRRYRAKQEQEAQAMLVAVERFWEKQDAKFLYPLEKAVLDLRAMTHHEAGQGFFAQVLDSAYNAHIIWQDGPFESVDDAWTTASLQKAHLEKRRTQMGKK